MMGIKKDYKYNNRYNTYICYPAYVYVMMC